MAERTVLVVMLGNTRWKWGVAVDGVLQDTAMGAYPLPDTLPSAERALVLSVVPAHTPDALRRLHERTGRVWTGEEARALVPVCYPHSRQFGEDRLALVAFGMMQDHPTVVLDAGTALTVNVVHPRRGLVAGAILPGFDLAFHALHTGTAALPDLRPAVPSPQARGCSTEEAIQVGVVEGLARGAFALGRRFLETLGLEDTRWWLTGGRAALLAPYVPDARTDPLLALKGAVWLVQQLEAAM